MAFQGEYFVQRYGATEASLTPPLVEMLAADVPVGAGTDATRVASYNPWVSLYWLTSGRTLGGLQLYAEDRVLDRETALRLWTKGSAWFSGEQAVKGSIAKGEFADLAVLSADYFSVPDEDIKTITSLLTMVGGRVVHADGAFRDLAPELPPASPDWSPARHSKPPALASMEHAAVHLHCTKHFASHHVGHTWQRELSERFWGSMGCGCFAF